MTDWMLDDSDFINKHCTIPPKPDNRGYPDGAASPPFDWEGSHWKEGYPDKPGWYAVALFDDSAWHQSCFGLPVERAFYEGDCKWSRRKGKRNSLMHEKYYYEDFESHCITYRYYVEYWCEIPESGELPRCYFDW